MHIEDHDFIGSDTLTVTANDGTDTTTGSTPINIVNPLVNDGTNHSDTLPPTIDGVSPIELHVSDPTTTPDQIVYTIITNPDHGTITSDGQDLGVGGQFTQQDVNNGTIGYRNDGTAPSQDSFIYAVRNGRSTIIDTLFNFSIQHRLLAEPLPSLARQLFNNPGSEPPILLNFRTNFHGNGFFDVAGANQLTSFGDRMGYSELVRLGYTSIGFDFVNGEPQLSHRSRDSGFGSAVSALDHVVQNVGFRSNAPSIQQNIEELASENAHTQKDTRIAKIGKDFNVIAQNLIKRFRK